MSDQKKYKLICKLSLQQQLKNFLDNTHNDWNYITPMDFYNNYWSKNRTDYILVDLRKKEEYDIVHIPNSINIYWLDILNDENLKLLPQNKKIFLICYVGHTSSQAMVLLKLLGYNVTSIKFGMGISPTVGVPVAGWTNYNLPVVRCDDDKVKR